MLELKIITKMHELILKRVYEFLGKTEWKKKTFK